MATQSRKQGKHTVYLEVLIAEKKNAPKLTLEEQRKAPTHFLKSTLINPMYLEINYTPATGVTEQMIIEQQIKALKREVTVKSYRKLEQKNNQIDG